MNDDKKKKPDNQTPWKNPMFLFLMVAVIGTFIFNMAMTSYTSRQQEEITYDQFLSMVREGKVDEVIIKSDQLMIYEKSPEIDTKTTEDTDALLKLFGINPQEAAKKTQQENRKVYFTGYLPDSRVYEILDENGVKYSTPIAYNNPILDFFLAWIFPPLLICLLFFFLTRSLSKRMGGGGIMGIGQSNAKMYNMENKTGVTLLTETSVV